MQKLLQILHTCNSSFFHKTSKSAANPYISKADGNYYKFPQFVIAITSYPLFVIVVPQNVIVVPQNVIVVPQFVIVRGREPA